jgi:hypothetical protein
MRKSSMEGLRRSVHRICERRGVGDMACTSSWPSCLGRTLRCICEQSLRAIDQRIQVFRISCRMANRFSDLQELRCAQQSRVLAQRTTFLNERPECLEVLSQNDGARIGTTRHKCLEDGDVLLNLWTQSLLPVPAPSPCKSTRHHEATTGKSARCCSQDCT